MKRPLLLACSSILMLGAASTQANNLINNPNFAVNVDGWSNGANSSIQFDAAQDANAAANSGSVAILETVSASNPYTAQQCIVAPTASTYSFGAMVLAGSAAFYRMTCTAFASADCSGSELGSADADEGSPNANDWIPLDTATPFTLPGGTGSVLCEVSGGIPVRRDGAQPAGGQIVLWADDVYFGEGTTPVSLQSFSVN